MGQMSKISILLIYGGQGPGQVRKIKGEVSNVSRMIADFGPFFWNQGTGNTGGHQVNRGGQIASFQENLWFNVMLSKNMVDFMSEILPWLSFYKRKLKKRLGRRDGIPIGNAGSVQ